ncbi:unnamed protein product [Cuscuta campestris]|uniref:Reverse transcriptase domain-containing protein n=1 Tax=Cuscuta campestris TaxID=132261 RepID=A0A484LIQ6_9ASTE|nr:unnamed protein product [Cuscuta campestris]
MASQSKLPSSQSKLPSVTMEVPGTSKDNSTQNPGILLKDNHFPPLPSSSKPGGGVTSPMLKEIIEIEDVTHEDYPELIQSVDNSILDIATSAKLNSAYRVYLDTLLNAGLSEEAINFTINFKPKGPSGYITDLPKSNANVGPSVKTGENSASVPLKTVVQQVENTVSVKNALPLLKKFAQIPYAKPSLPGPKKQQSNVPSKTPGHVTNPGTGPPNKLSYAQMVGPQIAQAQSTNSTLNHNLLPDREVVVHRDIPTIRFAATEIESLAKIDIFILVGKFSHGQPKWELIKKHFATQYILRGQVTIGWRDSRHVFLTYSNLQDCTKILLKGLPIHFFDASVLALICKPIGKVLGVDLAILHKSKPHVARVRVEMNLLKPLIHNIFIGTSTEPGKEDEGIYQSFEYERIPFYCTKCFKQGHATEKCKLDVEAGSGFMRQGRRRSRSRGKMAYPIPPGSVPNQSQTPQQAPSGSVSKQSPTPQQIPSKGVPKPPQQATQRSELPLNSKPLKGNSAELPPLPKTANGSQSHSGQIEHPKNQKASSSGFKNTPHYNKDPKSPKQPKYSQNTDRSTINMVPQSSNAFAILSDISENPLMESLPRSGKEIQDLAARAISNFPLLPVPKPPDDSISQMHCAENTSANPSNRSVFFEEIDHGPGEMESDVTILDDTEQMVNLELFHLGSNSLSYVSVVYAKTKSWLRRTLWRDLRDFYTVHPDTPWAVLGDFNCSLHPGEKQGGLLMTFSSSWDFQQCIDDCDLVEAPSCGSYFTWWNGRKQDKAIWKRLDRMLVNQAWSASYTTMVHNLIPTTSDHSPMHVTSVFHQEYQGRKPFSFMNAWITHPDFLTVVSDAWSTPISSSAMYVLTEKLKITKKALQKWNFKFFGNIFQKLNQFEAQIQEAEQHLQEEPSESNFLKLKHVEASYLKQLHIEDLYWKQKAHSKWIKDGDRNSKYFHSIVKGRRRRLTIHKIKSNTGQWLTSHADISHEAVTFFHNLFSAESTATTDFGVLDCVPNLVTEEDNHMLVAQPDLEEIKNAVFALDPNSAAGPDGFTGQFYQSCWSIINKEVFQMVQGFFWGDYFSKGISHTFIILLPKVDCPNTFADFRPISLCNFSSKIVSKILATRLAKVLPKIISPNQSGFIKGRSITENVLLAQELCHGMKAINRDIIFKLDMAKAYDRVSWYYMNKIQRQLGFSDKWIDIIFRLLSNNWYSVIINGAREGFFTSSRGLRQGDPLSPGLFIIGAELISQMLNQRIQQQASCLFSQPNGISPLNHLAFADDMIIFTSGKVSFWWDNWSGIGALGAVSNQLNGKYLLEPLKTYTLNKQFDFSKLVDILDPGFFFHFNVNLDLIGSNVPDQPIWKPKSNGQFSMQAVKHFHRPNNSVDNVIINCWHPCVPFKISFLYWRVLFQKLPMDDFLMHIGIPTVSKCYCCTHPHAESLEHVFCNGELAHQVWKHYEYVFGIHGNSHTIRQHLHLWWKNKLHSQKPAVREFLQQCVPIFILWVWRAYSSIKYGGCDYSVARVIHLVGKEAAKASSRKWPSLNEVLPHWKSVFKLAGTLPKSFMIKKVCWQYPEGESVKLNLAGGQFPHQTAAAAVLRNSKGEFLFGYASSSPKPKYMVYLEVAVQVLSWGLAHGFRSIIIETDEGEVPFLQLGINPEQDDYLRKFHFLLSCVRSNWVGPAVGLAVLLWCECGPTLLKYLIVRLCSLAIVPRLDLLCCFVVRTVCGIGHAVV